jgi:hypothetical protein
MMHHEQMLSSTVAKASLPEDKDRATAQIWNYVAHAHSLLIIPHGLYARSVSNFQLIGKSFCLHVYVSLKFGMLQFRSRCDGSPQRF